MAKPGPYYLPINWRRILLVPSRALELASRRLSLGPRNRVERIPALPVPSRLAGLRTDAAGDPRTAYKMAYELIFQCAREGLGFLRAQLGYVVGR